MSTVLEEPRVASKAGFLVPGECRVPNLSIGFAQLGLPWFRIIWVAGPEGPAYRFIGTLCRRVLQVFDLRRSLTEVYQDMVDSFVVMPSGPPRWSGGF